MNGCVESEAARAIDEGGFKSPYLEREIYSENEPAKVKCRERVARYLLSKHDAGRLRLFSLPSLHWRFEHLIRELHSATTQSKCEFIAVERDASILRQSMNWMPGDRPCWFDRGFESFTFEGARTDCAWLIHLDCETFLRLGQRWLLTSRERSIWHLYRAWSAVWLDFNSQLSQSLELALPKIGAGCDCELEYVPVVVTFMKGREPEHIQEKIIAAGGSREDYVARLLNSGRHRTFRIDETFEYTTGTGIVMNSVMGCLVRKPVDPPRDHLEVHGARIPNRSKKIAMGGNCESALNP